MSSSLCSCSIIGTGSYAPEKVLTNDDLSKIVDTNDEWITSRTGIKERHIAREDEATSDMAAEAAKRALASAGLAATDVDLIIVATVTPDMFFPSTSCLVQKKIGATKAFCFDVSAACSGFIYALQTARHYLNSGQHSTALVIGAEKLSSLVNWSDRNTCVLFGDAAGAVVLKRHEHSSSDSKDKAGVLSSVMVFLTC
jgi:3-oxoacyl-[acyl-carrier-protein] synthase III